ncbi:MAG TPA: hypothetical protein VES38_06650 [Methylotenera sp.]|nr:hypothetical protein [Methylotenera sp.]
MFVLPKDTLVHFCGMPFRLLHDVETDGLESNYKLATSHLATSSGKFDQAPSPTVANFNTNSLSSESI